MLIDMTAARASFRNALPDNRLGTEHPSFQDFAEATPASSSQTQKIYTLIVVSTNSGRILLGEKHRGFGKGFYNSFGGKLEAGETIAEGAVRELEEETGIVVPTAKHMEACRVGKLHFTFADNETEMRVHLFHVKIVFDSESLSESVASFTLSIKDPSHIRGCDEITPRWFDDWRQAPLQNMFADDSIWLPIVLTEYPILLDGWFHFHSGGQNTNSIAHYHLACTKAPTVQRNNKGFTLQQRLFHELHNNKVHSPNIKEFKETVAFANAVRSVFGPSAQNKHAFDTIIDVAGGHGALAAFFLITTSAKRAIVVDPADVGGGGVELAWGSFFEDDQILQYRYECLRTGLPSILDEATNTTSVNRILVVACHACQHLSDEVLEISCRYGVHAAVMPCCQKDPSLGSNWKSTSKKLGIPIATCMDLLLAGKCMSWTTSSMRDVTYDVRMKTIDPKITPQNRIIVCRAQYGNSASKRDKAHRKLESAYRRAHDTSVKRKREKVVNDESTRQKIIGALSVGVVLGWLLSRRV